jgi:hypothetical protein
MEKDAHFLKAFPKVRAARERQNERSLHLLLPLAQRAQAVGEAVRAGQTLLPRKTSAHVHRDAGRRTCDPNCKGVEGGPERGHRIVDVCICSSPGSN